MLMHVPLAAAIILLVLVGAASSGRNLLRPLLAGVFTMMALQSIRHEPLFAIVFVLVVGDVVRERWQWARRENDSPARPSGILHWAVLFVLVSSLLLGLERLPFETQLQQSPQAGSFPAEGASYVEAYFPESRMFNSYRWGGYLVNSLYPAKHVFVDGRADVYGGEIVADYVSVISLEPAWQEILEKYQIDLVVIEKDSPLAQALRQNRAWNEVFHGKVEAIFKPAP
jgi:hypothetical protein